MSAAAAATGIAAVDSPRKLSVSEPDDAVQVTDCFSDNGRTAERGSRPSTQERSEQSAPTYLCHKRVCTCRLAAHMGNACAYRAHVRRQVAPAHTRAVPAQIHVAHAREPAHGYAYVEWGVNST